MVAASLKEKGSAVKTFNYSILRKWLELRNHAAKHPGAYLPETKLRARERARLWIRIIREGKR